MQIGGLLEELTVAKARAGIEKLVHLTPQTARVVLREMQKMERVIPAEEVLAGKVKNQDTVNVVLKKKEIAFVKV